MNDKLDIEVLTSSGDNEQRVLFMSFGLLNELCSAIGGPERVALVDADADLAGAVISIVLIPRQPSGKPSVKQAEYEEPGLTTETAETVLDWVKDHVLSFFCRRIEANLKMLDENKDRLQQIGLSVTGLQLEASKK